MSSTMEMPPLSLTWSSAAAWMYTTETAKRAGEVGDPCRHVPQFVVLAINTNDDLTVAHETVSLVHQVHVGTHGPHLAKRTAAGNAWESRGDVHEKGLVESASPPRPLGLRNGQSDRIDGRAASPATVLARLEASSGLAMCADHHGSNLLDHLAEPVEE